VKVTNEKTENSQAFLAIEMEPAEVEESLEASYYRLGKKTRVPGFRKGKAPRDILERYLGKESLLEDALNNLFPKAYENAIKEQGIEAIAQPQVEVAQVDPVVFKVIVPLAPTIELGDYHNIRIEPEPAVVTEDEVNATIEQMRHQHAAWEPVDHPVAFDDLVTLDVESSIEGEPFINQGGAQFQVIRDLPVPVPGFAEKISGMKRDEEKEFSLKFPSDYSRGDLAGKEPSFKVKVIEIKQERLPDLDDEFARSIDPDFKTLDSLREQVSAKLKLGAEEQAKVDFEERVIEAVVDISKVEFPPVMAEVEIDRILNQQAQRWQRSGKNLEDYLKSINKTEEKLREELRPPATKSVTRSLVMGKISQEEKIEVSDAEIDTEIENITKDADEAKRDGLKNFLNTPKARESIKRTLIAQKTIQRLVEIAKGSEGE
jgi:trigger factor